MTAMQKQLVVSLADIRYLSIYCPRCRTTVTLDMKEPPQITEKHSAFAPKICPGCRDDYDTAIRSNVDRLYGAYKALEPIADRIGLRGEPEAG